LAAGIEEFPPLVRLVETARSGRGAVEEAYRECRAAEAPAKESAVELVRARQMRQMVGLIKELHGECPSCISWALADDCEEKNRSLQQIIDAETPSVSEDELHDAQRKANELQTQLDGKTDELTKKVLELDEAESQIRTQGETITRITADKKRYQAERNEAKSSEKAMEKRCNKAEALLTQAETKARDDIATVTRTKDDLQTSYEQAQSALEQATKEKEQMQEDYEQAFAQATNEKGQLQTHYERAQADLIKAIEEKGHFQTKYERVQADLTKAMEEKDNCRRTPSQFRR
jgi:chromosome segregation ATPase